MGKEGREQLGPVFSKHAVMVGKSGKSFLAGQALQGRAFQGQAPIVRQHIGNTLKLQIIISFVTSI